MKLIDRDELLATIEADMVIQDVVVASDRDARILENLMRDLLNDVKDSPVLMEWIPIGKEAPKMGEDVLISHGGVLNIDWLSLAEGNGYFFISGVAIQDIDAWMPLPEPYKEGEEHETD